MDRSEMARKAIREQQRRTGEAARLQEAARRRQEGQQLKTDLNSSRDGVLSPKMEDTLIRASPEAFERQRILSGRPLTAVERSKVEEARRQLEPQRRALQTAERNLQSKSDVVPKNEHNVEIELERRQAEAARDWRHSPDARAEFAQTVGKQEHLDWQNEIRRSETAHGRIEGKDYAIEHTLTHPDGGSVRYDYVDFKNHRIVDRKAQAGDESDLDLVKAYKEQQRRHIEAYRARFGRTPTYEYSPYPSTKELFRIEEEGRQGRDSL